MINLRKYAITGCLLLLNVFILVLIYVAYQRGLFYEAIRELELEY